ncbi:MAG: endonuclease/exonuclease/phosphatase family protein [Kiloniellales bacterium]|nr:endonuclease/exonuclease/phosphatase family protein [Kiloniellales bacterium]
MSLNGWGGKLQDRLLPFIAETCPDVLCLQEVVHTPQADKAWLTYRDRDIELAQRARFFEEVSGALPDHVAVFCPAARGDLWDGDRRYDSQWGLATFVRKSLPIIAQKQGFVHRAFSPYGYGDHPRPRNAHAVRIFDYERGFPVTVVHLHGLRDLAGKQDTPARLAQARRLASLTQSVAESDDRTVVCGDFNVLPESRTFQVMAEIGLRDLVTGRGFQSTRTSHYKKPGKFADYMFVSSALADASFAVLDTPEVSDHRPLLLSIDKGAW